MRITLSRILFFTLLMSFSLIAKAQASAPFLEDGFENNFFQNFWSSRTSVTITTEKSSSGSGASKWVFSGGSLTDDAWAEARFNLGKAYPEVTIVFDWFIPENYHHRNASGPDNNKFFRIWADTYNDLEKIGASTYNQSGGGSSIGEDYRKQADKGISTNVTSSSNFITADDLNKWMAIRIYVKAATDSSPAIMRIYKNGRLFHDASKIYNNYVPGTQGFRYGYLLGWANSGFDQDTIFYIDNVKFMIMT